MTRPARATVLIVDDCADDREMFSHFLLAAGYRVLKANGAEQAQQLAEEQGKIDLLVTDFNMPGMNGGVLAEWFHSRSPLTQMLLVSDAVWQIEAYMEKAGWIPFLDKKETPDWLAATAQKLLAGPGRYLRGHGAADLARRSSGGTMVTTGEQTAGSVDSELRCQRTPPYHVLVVDDEPLVLKFNIEMLIASGYQVDAAKDGAAAWDSLQLNTFDLVITDNNMPNLTGVGLIEKIRASGMTVPVIMATSAFPTEEFAGRPWLDPAATLLKPYALVDFLGTVKNVLGLVASTAMSFPCQATVSSPIP